MTKLLENLKRFIISLIINSLFITSAFAGQQITVSVLGMVCSFCATSIETTFSKEPKVESIDIDLNKKKVTINLKEGEDLTDTKIKELFTDAGYDVDGIYR